MKKQGAVDEGIGFQAKKRAIPSIALIENDLR
jgi:hypothetical protein